MKNLMLLIRPHQWIKNLIVFLPVFFGGALLQQEAVYAGLITVLSFSLTASSIYCLNDIVDVHDDRQRPVKCHRPMASGAASITQGYILMELMFVLLMSSTFLLHAHQVETASVIIFYWLPNIGYCFRLKRYAITDVCVATFGFVLRILAGEYATDIYLSEWIALMTSLLMLFLSFAKRRDGVARMNETGHAPRQNTICYNLTFINQAIMITTSVTLMYYIMYTISPEIITNFHTDHLYLTSVFILLGLLCYIQISVVDKRSGDPTKVMIHDRFMQLIVLVFGLAFLLIIYVLKNIQQDMRKIYAFDFDSALTIKDTLLEFIRFAKGSGQMFHGFLLFSPLLTLMKLYFFPNWKTKQKIFSYFFKGMSINDFNALCTCFAEQNKHLLRPAGIEKVRQAIEEGQTTVLIISAGIDNWIQPFSDETNRKIQVIGTQIETKGGRLTGQFTTKNCYGQGKVDRLTAPYLHREAHELIAFGDGRGDKELLDFADKAFYKPFRNKKQNVEE